MSNSNSWNTNGRYYEHTDFSRYYERYSPTQPGGIQLERYTSPSPAPALDPNIVEFIKGMPKTALHMHLEGSLEAPMAFSFAKKYNMLPLSVPNAQGGATIVNTLDDLKKVYKFTPHDKLTPHMHHLRGSTASDGGPRVRQ